MIGRRSFISGFAALLASVSGVKASTIKPIDRPKLPVEIEDRLPAEVVALLPANVHVIKIAQHNGLNPVYYFSNPGEHHYFLSFKPYGKKGFILSWFDEFGNLHHDYLPAWVVAEDNGDIRTLGFFDHGGAFRHNEMKCDWHQFNLVAGDNFIHTCPVPGCTFNIRLVPQRIYSVERITEFEAKKLLFPNIAKEFDAFIENEMYYIKQCDESDARGNPEIIVEHRRCIL